MFKAEYAKHSERFQLLFFIHSLNSLYHRHLSMTGFCAYSWHKRVYIGEPFCVFCYQFFFLCFKFLSFPGLLSLLHLLLAQHLVNLHVLFCTNVQLYHRSPQTRPALPFLQNIWLNFQSSFINRTKGLPGSSHILRISAHNKTQWARRGISMTSLMILVA